MLLCVLECRSILRFCMPAIFNTDMLRQIAEIDYDPNNAHVTSLFRNILTPFILRRLKLQVSVLGGRHQVRWRGRVLPSRLFSLSLFLLCQP
jgi:SNF2 family DNA or RNA helicase